MFQPQPTPYAATFASYGPSNHPPTDQDSVSDAYSFQSAGLALRTGGPLTFDNPIFSPVADFHSSPAALAPPQHRYAAMNTPPADDLAAQEALARAYQPDVKGPLMGDKESSMTIAAEYAKADPIYVAKTSSLPHTYSHYRSVRGDGNCGWRAIGLSYFEALVRLGDKDLIQAESARMMSLSDLVVNMCGYEAWIFEDMRDACLNLLGDSMGLVNPAPHVEAPQVLLDRFNNAEISNGIVYWLRLISSAYLRTHAATFQDFIPELIGVDAFCKDVLEPTNTEIDNLGMTLLVAVLLEPIGMAVDIVYLDRSEGAHVNVHCFGRETIERPRAVINLLYRPGHYDILYKETPAPRRSLPISQQQLLDHAADASDVRVNLVTTFPLRHSIQGTPAGFQGLDMSLLASIPLFSPLGPNHGYAEPCTTAPDYANGSRYASSYADSCARTANSISPTSSLSPTPQEVYTPATTLPIHPSHSSTLGSEPLSPGRHTPSRSMTLPLSPPSLMSPSVSSGQFRPSMYQYKDDWGDGPAQGFQTSTFKNSHYNTSHYNNPNFQPEQWTPDCDEAVGRITRRGTS